MNPKPEYRSKVIDDNGLIRGKVPSPLLREMGARPGDAMVFRRIGSGRAVMQISRARKRSTKKRR